MKLALFALVSVMMSTAACVASTDPAGSPDESPEVAEQAHGGSADLVGETPHLSGADPIMRAEAVAEKDELGLDEENQQSIPLTGTCYTSTLSCTASWQCTSPCQSGKAIPGRVCMYGATCPAGYCRCCC